MAGCLDSINFNPPEWLSHLGGEYRNTASPIASGILFFLGWWIIIDVAAVYPEAKDFNHAYHVCGVFATVSLFMVNAVSNSTIGESYTEGFLGQNGARIWLFLGFVLGFASMIASTWILFAAYLFGNSDVSVLPGLGLFTQNLFIFLGSLIFKFGRTYEDVI